MEGLAGLFQKKNPYERKIKATGEMMGSSGFAKPFLALAMGRDVANAGEWDTERETEANTALTANMGMLKAKQDQENKGMVIDKMREALATGNAEFIRNAANMLGLGGAEKMIADVEVDKASKSTTFKIEDLKSGGVEVLNIGPMGPQIWDGKQWVKATQEDIVNLGKPSEAKKLEYDEGVNKVTEITRPDGTKEIKKSAKWNPDGGGGGGPNTVYLEGPNGDLKAMDKKDIPSLQRMLDTGYKPYKDEDLRALQELINLKILPELNKERAKEGLPPRSLKKPAQAPAAPTNAAPAGGVAAQMNPDGTVTVNGTRYKPDQSGVIVVNGKKFKVNR